MTDTIIAVSLSVLAGVALIVLTLTAPLVRDLRRAVSRIDAALARYEQDLGPLLAQARLTLVEMQRGAARVQAITGRVDRTVQLLDQAGRLLSGVRNTLGRNVAPPVATVAAAIEGIRQAVQFVFSPKAGDRNAWEELENPSGRGNRREGAGKEG